MKWLDLFSGIRMYALGLEQAGHEIVGFCEKDLWARKILKKHWPTKPVSWCIKSLNEALMESLPDGLARICPLQQEPVRKALKVNDQDFGRRYIEPFAWYDQSSHCWRTWQLCLIEGWARFLEAWPKSGVMHNGIVYELKPLVCPMIEKDFISLPTPCASDYKGSSRKRYRGSPNFRGGRITEVLRICQSDPIYTHPNFAEAVMGLPKDYTALEMEIPPLSSEKLQEG